jgi:hypothetical protein
MTTHDTPEAYWARYALATAHGEWLVECMERQFTPAEQQLHAAILAILAILTAVPPETP